MPDPEVRGEGQPARDAGGVDVRHAVPALPREVPPGVLAESPGKEKGSVRIRKRAP